MSIHGVNARQLQIISILKEASLEEFLKRWKVEAVYHGQS
jgi:hypothetical protein